MNTSKVALVTGANRGMGLETCRALAQLDFHVLLGSRDLAAGAEAAQSIGSDRVEPIKLDVTDPSDIDLAAQFVGANFNQLDVLINNAGILIDGAGGKSTSICAADIDIVEQSLNANTLGPLRLINAMLPYLEKVDDARIVNISSGMGQLSDMGGNYPGYRLSKTALNAMTRIFAAELDPKRFSINAVCPGWVRTDMGGEKADLSLAEGIDTAIWLATAAEARSSGGFYRRRKLIDW